MNGLSTGNAIKLIFDEYGLGEKLLSFYEQEISKAEADFVFVIPRKCLTEYKALVDARYVNSVFLASEKQC